MDKLLQMCLKRVAERRGVAMEKALSPQVLCLVLCGGERGRFIRGRKVAEGVESASAV